MCTSDCTSNSGGVATLYFSGSLVSALTGGTTTLVTTAVPFTVILANELQEYSVGTGGISTASLDMREVW